jgi:hypothetical protein
MKTEIKIKEGDKVVITKPGKDYGKTGTILPRGYGDSTYRISLDVKEYRYCTYFKEHFEYIPVAYKKHLEFI